MNDDNTVLVTIAVSAQRWLQRLLLRLGTDVEVVAAESFEGADNLGSAAAAAVLARYQR